MGYWTIFCSKPVTFSVIPIITTYTTEQSHSWDTKRSSGSQITRILWNLHVHYHIHMSLPPVLIPSQINPVHVPPHPTSWRHTLILSSHLCPCLKNGLSPSGFTTKTLHAPLLPPHMLHSPPITSFFTWSPKYYWVQSTDHEVPHYAILSTPLLPRPS